MLHECVTFMWCQLMERIRWQTGIDDRFD